MNKMLLNAYNYELKLTLMHKLYYSAPIRQISDNNDKIVRTKILFIGIV